MDGLLNVLKPPGMTSHDVVNYIRRLTGIKKAGHTGTLDPGAAGVLLVCCGKATRLIEYLDHTKQYLAEISFGAFSSTGDAFGQLEETGVPGSFCRDALVGVLPSFTGDVSQIPPMTSAVRHQGKKLYELSRRGVVVKRQARTVQIYSLSLVRWYGGERPRAVLDVRCSAGTYIRTLCADIGKRLGLGAYMSFLLRTGVGGFYINGSRTLEELQALKDRHRLEDALVSNERALSFLPAVEINHGAVNSVRSGAALHMPGVGSMPEGVRDGDLAVLRFQGKVMAVARALAGEDGRLSFKPEKVLV